MLRRVARSLLLLAAVAASSAVSEVPLQSQEKAPEFLSPAKRGAPSSEAASPTPAAPTTGPGAPLPSAPAQQAKSNESSSPVPLAPPTKSKAGSNESAKQAPLAPPPKPGAPLPPVPAELPQDSAPPCLCSFDIDRTLTGKQNDLGTCQQNEVLPSVTDTAYGGGELTLSQVGQGLEGTFCDKCYVAVVTAGDASGFESKERGVLVEKLGANGKLESNAWTGPSLHHEARADCSGIVVDSPLVVGCVDGTKQFAVASIVSWLEASRGVKIAPERVWHFDDREQNVAAFAGTGFNARMVSCGSRDGPKSTGTGLCGASKSEILDTVGVSLCP